MKLLLDSHIFLFYIAGSDRLAEPLRLSLQSAEHQLYLSVVSIWELMLKCSMGKLVLPAPAAHYLKTQRMLHNIETLDINEGTIDVLEQLPHLHRDPFDRIMIAQTIQHQMKLVTQDQTICKYQVDIHS